MDKIIKYLENHHDTDILEDIQIKYWYFQL